MHSLAGILVGLLLLSILMFIHEMGHFLVGKKLGFTIIEFSIFMGPRLLSWERKGIRYSLKLIPIGASVQFAGEYNGDPKGYQEAVDTGYVPQPGDFFQRPCWARALVSFAGPFVNLVAGVLAFAVLFATLGFVEPVISSVAPDSAAQAMGLQEGDRILWLNGTTIENDLDLRYALFSHRPDLVVRYQRGETEYEVHYQKEQLERPMLGIQMEILPEGLKVVAVQPRTANQPPLDLQEGDLILRVNGQVAQPETIRQAWKKDHHTTLELTVLRSGREVKVNALPILVKAEQPLGLTLTLDRSVAKALPRAWTSSVSLVKLTFRSIGQLISGEMKARDTVSGPIGIVSAISGVVTASSIDWSAKLQQLLLLFALISLSLGIMNLLPIPPLDGYNLLTTGLEAARGKPLSNRTQVVLTYVGLAIVLFLFILGFYYDLARLLGFGG